MTDQRTCVVCHTQTTPAFCCWDCQARLRDQLAELPVLYVECSQEFWPQGGGSSGRSPERTLGLRVAALDGRNPVDAIEKLESWERLLREELTPTEDPDLAQRKRKAHRWSESESDDHTGVTLCGVVDWLIAHLDAICREFPAVDEFALEVREVHKAARSAARVPSEPVTVVECPADHPDDPSRLCGKRLRLVADQAECPRCGASWDVGRLLMVAASTKAEVWQPASVVSERLGVSDSTLRRWAKDGLVRRRSNNYLWSSVVEMLESRDRVG